MEITEQDEQPAGKTANRPVGRPRADGRPQLTRDTVLITAAVLIAEKGYAGTSIRTIAGALDAVPASIFNLFSSKDALLNDLITFVADPSLSFYRSLNEQELRIGVALYKSIFEEVKAVASAEHHFPALFYLPELAGPEFGQAQTVRAKLVAHYHALLKAGQESSEFLVDAPDLAAEQLFQLTETSIIASATASSLPVETQARTTARLCLRAVLHDPTQLAEIEALADKINLKIIIPPEALPPNQP